MVSLDNCSDQEESQTCRHSDAESPDRARVIPGLRLNCQFLKRTFDLTLGHKITRDKARSSSTFRLELD
jgi:5-methylcytosine-specific restriction endonuclease McrA